MSPPVHATAPPGVAHRDHHRQHTRERHGGGAAGVRCRACIALSCYVRAPPVRWRGACAEARVGLAFALCELFCEVMGGRAGSVLHQDHAAAVADWLHRTDSGGGGDLEDDDDAGKRCVPDVTSDSCAVADTSQLTLSLIWRQRVCLGNDMT